MAANLFKSLFGDDDAAQDEYYDDEPQPSKGNVVSINSVKRTPTSKIALYEPRLYTDVKQVANQLLNGQAVIVNFTQMEDKNAKRVVDFLNGTTYAIQGNIKRIGKEIFLCTPKNFEISGSLSASLRNNGENLTSN